MQPNNLTTLLLKLPRNTEVTPESAQTFLSALTQINSIPKMQKLFGKKAESLSLEIALQSQQIKFLITCDTNLVPFVETQLQSNYPLVIIEKINDPLENIPMDVLSLTLRKGNYYPILTYDSFTDIDPISAILSVLSKSDPNEVTLVQFALESTNGSWQGYGQKLAETGGGKNVSETGVVTFSPHPDANVIKEKISFPGFTISIRVGSNVSGTLREMASAFGVFTRSDGNSFGSKKSGILGGGKSKELKALLARQVTDNVIINIKELATLWHLPSNKVKTASIVWGNSVLSEPPENLPVATGMTDEQKQEVNFWGRTQFHNHEVVFGLKVPDRRRHVWNIGKTGTGKSTLIANMAIDDLKKDRGLGVIDPHGDLCETLLEYIPRHRINDTIYFNPADKDYPMIINPLEVTNREEAELVVSGIVSIFNKIFGFSWGPRLEYILRNSLMTLAEIPDSTLEDVLTILTNQNYRKRVIDQLTDPVLKNFWINEFNKMPDKLREESISPIMNKVGQFVTSPMIRRIIGQPKSSIQIDEIMNGHKIILANLSQGRLGEDNATLLGAMLITKFQLAAMRRVEIPEEQRQDFFLYVDEFQNFATPSFMKILSEARKYRLSLTLANQYMAQIPDEIQKSILGNAGSLIAFAVGAEDAAIIHKEYAEVFSEADLVNLSNHQIAVKLMVDGHSTRPFIAYTLPLPASRNENKEKVINISRERWATKQDSEEMERIKQQKLQMLQQQAQSQQNNQQNRGNQNQRRRGPGGGGQRHNNPNQQNKSQHQQHNQPKPQQPKSETLFEAPKQDNK